MSARREKGGATGRSRASGYTLIEMAVVLTLLGAMTAAAANVFARHFEVEALRETDAVLDAAERRLAMFFAANGRLPCPADGALTPSDPFYGEERCGADQPPDARAILPWRALDFRDREAVDGWSRRLSYLPATPELTASDNVDPGSIEVWSAATDGSRRTLRAAYVVLSHGANGRGAWSAQGARLAVSGASSNDAENLDGDARFVDADVGPLSSGADEHRLRWRERDLLAHLAAKWSRRVGEPTAIAELYPVWLPSIPDCNDAENVETAYLCEEARARRPECLVARTVVDFCVKMSTPSFWAR